MNPSADLPPPDAADIMGVFGLNPAGDWVLVHRYQGGEYGLEDVAGLFRIGTLTSPPDQSGPVTLSLAGDDLRDLKFMADTYSFDHDERFIEMCLEICRFAREQPADRYSLMANF
ncbi:MAG TPA: hypothetical protein VKA14_03775 [Gammaproteobacteria bacterium]|nr:hypothetical protein [Gammaproteobacteria bacterium]